MKVELNLNRKWSIVAAILSIILILWTFFLPDIKLLMTISQYQRIARYTNIATLIAGFAWGRALIGSASVAKGTRIIISPRKVDFKGGLGKKTTYLPLTESNDAEAITLQFRSHRLTHPKDRLLMDVTPDE